MISCFLPSDRNTQTFQSNSLARMTHNALPAAKKNEIATVIGRTTSESIIRPRSHSRWIGRRRSSCCTIGRTPSVNCIRVDVFRSIVRATFTAALVECVAIKEITKWSQFEPIYDKLQKVIEVETGELFGRGQTKRYIPFTSDLSRTNATWNRQEHLEQFNHWLHSNAIDTSSFELCPFEDYGFGLKATKTLAVTDAEHHSPLVR